MCMIVAASVPHATLLATDQRISKFSAANESLATFDVSGKLVRYGPYFLTVTDNIGAEVVDRLLERLTSGSLHQVAEAVEEMALEAEDLRFYLTPQHPGGCITIVDGTGQVKVDTGCYWTLPPEPAEALAAVGQMLRAACEDGRPFRTPYDMVRFAAAAFARVASLAPTVSPTIELVLTLRERDCYLVGLASEIAAAGDAELETRCGDASGIPSLQASLSRWRALMCPTVTDYSQC